MVVGNSDLDEVDVKYLNIEHGERLHDDMLEQWLKCEVEWVVI